MSSSKSKNVWRATMLQARQEIGPEKASQFNRAICKNLSFVWVEGGGLGDTAHKPLWAGYKSFRWEADPAQAIAESSPYLRWVYPRILNQTLDMEFLEPKAQDAHWLKNPWGLWEPDTRTAQKLSLNDCVGILVPGVAFDRKGRRLGYGKGFYDKALAGFTGLKVGVAFSAQVTAEDLPYDETDVCMDLIVTDKELIRTGPSRH